VTKTRPGRPSPPRLIGSPHRTPPSRFNRSIDSLRRRAPPRHFSFIYLSRPQPPRHFRKNKSIEREDEGEGDLCGGVAARFTRVRRRRRRRRSRAAAGGEEKSKARNPPPAPSRHLLLLPRLLRLPRTFRFPSFNNARHRHLRSRAERASSPSLSPSLSLPTCGCLAR
jgi:hypothetical protein